MQKFVNNEYSAKCLNVIGTYREILITYKWILYIFFYIGTYVQVVLSRYLE